MAYSKTHVGTLLGACALGLMAGTAGAGIVSPDLELHVQELTSGYDETFNPAGTPGALFYNYNIGIDGGDFQINGDINASPDLPGPSPALLSTTLSFTNDSSEAMDFIVTMTLPMSTGSIPAQWNTSSSWVLTGPDSSNTFLETLEGMSLWSVFIDDSPVASLFSDPSSMGGSGGGEFNLNTAPQGGQFGPVEESISIQLAFSIGPNSTGGPTGGFTLVPAPGALAAFGAAFVIGGRRRRR